MVQFHVVQCCHSNTCENSLAIVCMTVIHQCEMTCDCVCTAGLFCFTEPACSYYAAGCVLGYVFAAKLNSNKPICAPLSSRFYRVQSDRAIDAWQSHAALYLAIRQVSVARDITELLIAKLANAALQLEACEGASHAPEPDMPCACSKQTRGLSLSDGIRPCKTQQSRLCKELICSRPTVHRSMQ